MDDFTDTLLVALYNLLVIQWLDGWRLIMGLSVSAMYITYRIVMGLRQDKREREEFKKEQARCEEEHK